MEGVKVCVSAEGASLLTGVVWRVMGGEVVEADVQATGTVSGAKAEPQHSKLGAGCCHGEKRSDVGAGVSCYTSVFGVIGAGEACNAGVARYECVV